MQNQKISETLSKLLKLDHAPIALARIKDIPKNVPIFDDEAPSSCSFWRRAEKGVFATQAKDQMNCPIGGMVMGFTLTKDAQEELQKGIAMMCDVKYIEPREAEHIPSLPKSDAPLLYGPLADFPTDPQLLLLWLTPAQAMLLREASGDSHWTGDLPGGVFGRPACTALAIAANGKRAALSFGCAGMRAFTDTEDSHMLAAISGEMLPDLVQQLEKVSESNCAMQNFYRERKKLFHFDPKLP